MIFLLACTTTIDGTAPTDDPSKRWDTLLTEAVTDDGLVDYAVLRADPDPLDTYLGWLAQDPGELEVNARLARGINAYNAFTLAGVLHHWPVDSVRDVKLGLFGFWGAGFFVGQRFTYDGQTTNLKDLEDVQLRAGFQDPRIHAAINCASAGCPPLRDGLFTADDLDTQLDAAMTRFVETRVSLDGDQNVFSQIFEWFGDDFTAWTEHDTICAYAAQYDERFAEVDPSCPHRFEPYDWSLNTP
ncbi:MAG: DUF547 domain-containing protein [Proteobacteria bacterium]|nr:DUF547 domain-containing protein [Pseudomonadota bacterium]